MIVKIKYTSCTTRSDKEHFVSENLVEKKLFVSSQYWHTDNVFILYFVSILEIYGKVYFD